jgi:hypothetical protein
MKTRIQAILAGLLAAVATFYRSAVAPRLDKLASARARRAALIAAALTFIVISISLKAVIAAAIAFGLVIALNLVFKRFNR